MSLRSDIRVCCIALDMPRPQLYDRVNRRVRQMVEDGLETEVRTLVRAGYSAADPGMRAIGYREFLGGSTEPVSTARGTTESVGADSASEIRPARDVLPLIQRNTRRYAKRQITFFRSFDFAEWMAADRPEKIVKRVFESFDNA